MTKPLKLNVILAKTDVLASSFRAMLNDFIGFFNKEQGQFKGVRKTYAPRPGTIDLPTERGNVLVVTTVDEKLRWLEETSKDYIDALFTQEATNASGLAKSNLIVDGKDWGVYTSLELLRLKSLIENGEFERMYANIPVRSDSEEWSVTNQELYSMRHVIYESPIQSGIKKSVLKEAYILPDPNITKETGAKYVAQVAQKDSIQELGDYTFQRFSGEWSHRQRAELLRKRQNLLTSIIEALKIANEVEVIQSKLNSEKIFNYLHG